MANKKGVYRQVQLYLSEGEERMVMRKGMLIGDFLNKVKEFAINRAIKNLEKVNGEEAREAINHYYEEEKRLSEGGK